MTKLPQGFRFAGVHTGVKQNPNKPDLTLVVSDTPATAAGAYTKNLVVAAPVVLDRARTPMKDARVVVVNSGNANACTGERGMQDAVEMTRLAAQACGAEPHQALVMSTGIIGRFMPMEKIKAGITNAASKLGDDETSFTAAARGILTTDKQPKTASRTLVTSQGEVQLTAMAKGAGMIGPNMATLLALVVSDAALSTNQAQAALTAATDLSFNCISVEGHTSTNDTALLLANGQATGGELNSDDFALFQHALSELLIEVAKMIPADGEGATHLMHVQVNGCKTASDARQIAKTVAASNLVKTAVAGGDPNWGRIVSAAGYAGVSFDPALVDLHVNSISLYQKGAPIPFDERATSKSIKENHDTHIQLDIHQGEASALFWASDLTVEYVTFNSEYTT